MPAEAPMTIQTQTETPPLLRRDEAGVAWLTLNRPAARNALSRTLLRALDDTLAAIEADPAARVVVIGGAGPGFCAGHDLREMRADPSPEAMSALFAQCTAVMTRIVRLAKPVIARVHGIATAAGCQLVASCDLAVAASDARFGTNGIDAGLFCSTPMVALSRNVGRKAAMEMLLTGDLIDARHAQAIGLINRPVPPDELDGAVAALAAKIAGKSARAVAIGKQAFYRQVELGLDAAYAVGAEAMTCNMQAHDALEGIDAFLAKRAPVWTDR
jgi:enoyl-CoA hydratase/carnithine racemase